MGMPLHKRIENLENWIKEAKKNSPSDVKELEKTLNYLYGQEKRKEIIYDNQANCYSKH